MEQLFIKMEMHAKREIYTEFEIEIDKVLHEGLLHFKFFFYLVVVVVVIVIVVVVVLLVISFLLLLLYLIL